MTQVNIISAVRALRSYNRAVIGQTHDPNSIQSWITRYAENETTLKDFSQDAAIGLLGYMNNPIYSVNLTPDQIAWAGMYNQAEQLIAQEAYWQNEETIRVNETSFFRVFTEDINWLHQYMTHKGVPSQVPLEYYLNMLIDDLRSCHGNSNAGSISHTIKDPTMFQPTP
jgi:hypothetical protein